MTRDDMKRVEALFEQRDAVLRRLKDLHETGKATPSVQCSALMKNGNRETFFISMAYLGAQWTAELTDVERRIRDAGGTI